MRLESGRQLGTSKLVGLLGAGRMGEVYRATDSTLHREVSLKVCRMSWLAIRSEWRGLNERQNCSLRAIIREYL